MLSVSSYILLGIVYLLYFSLKCEKKMYLLHLAS